MTDPAPIQSPIINRAFPHHWQAQILPERPAILPARHFTYPAQVEEVERGALEILIHPNCSDTHDKNSGAPGLAFETRDESPMNLAPKNAQEFLATCALGFRDPAAPTGLWSTPNPYEICAVSGGYAYLIDITLPTRFTMLPYRPVLQIHPAPAANLLLFVSHRDLLAWGPSGLAWESKNLSDEGLTITSIDALALHGRGWSLLTDKETPFALDLRTGLHIA